MLLLLPADAQSRISALSSKMDPMRRSLNTASGDRVRYFSSERNSWEELPSSMIDWEATDKYAQQACGRPHSAGKRLCSTRGRRELKRKRAPQC